MLTAMTLVAERSTRNATKLASEGRTWRPNDLQEGAQERTNSVPHRQDQRDPYLLRHVVC